MNKTSTPNQLFYPQGNSKLIKVFVTVFLLFMCSFGFSQTSTLYDFNTTGQLTGVFNSSGPGVANVVESVTGGIGNSGSITVPETSTDAIFATKDGYSLGPVGSTYRFESFIKSVYNSGYSGLGFTPASPASGSTATAFRPDNSLGISVHGGGFIFHNGTTNYEGNWQDGSVGDITAVKSADPSFFPLLNIGSPDSWYRIIFVITRSSSTEYDLRVEVWPANDDGTLIRPAEADAIFEVNGVTNSDITSAPLIYSYFSFSGQRVSHFDNYGIELSGGATVVTAGSPVVLSTSSSLAGDIVTINGNVTSDNGSAVTDRGFVYATSPNPTIADTKVSISSGTGTFSGDTPPLAGGTYYFRTFATNAEGTSYGSELEETILAGLQNFSWSADNLSAGATGVTYTFSFTTLTALSSATSDLILYAYNGAGGWDLSSVTVGDVSVTIDAANRPLSSFSPILSNRAGLVNLVDKNVPAGSDVVITITNVTNNSTAGSYSWSFIRTAFGSGAEIDAATSPNPIVLSASTSEFIWSADMSTEDGATDGNWEGGLAPPTGSDILIPEGATPYPVFDFDFEAGDITIGNNATFTMAPGFTLTFA
ncbi:hypothetical protein ACFCT7_14425, partial [Fulvivirgaceae bacterium LMO-SS25]